MTDARWYAVWPDPRSRSRSRVLESHSSRIDRQSCTGLIILLHFVGSGFPGFAFSPSAEKWTFFLRGLELCPLTLTYELDLNRVNVNHRAKYLGHMLFRSTVIVRTHAHTTYHTHAHAHTANKLVGKNGRAADHEKFVTELNASEGRGILLRSDGWRMLAYFAFSLTYSSPFKKLPIACRSVSASRQ